MSVINPDQINAERLGLSARLPIPRWVTAVSWTIPRRPRRSF